MKFLSWYSVVVVGWSLVSLLIQILAGTSALPETDMWAIAVYIPIQVFLILVIVKGKVA